MPWAGLVAPGSERVLEVEETGGAPIAALECLRQIDRLREGLESIDHVAADLRNVDRRGFLQFHDRDACVVQLAERLSDVLELDRLVADVEDDPEVAANCG